MYRYGDGTPFPLDENFIETLTAAVETCTNAFLPLAELEARKQRAKDARREVDMEIARLGDLEKALTGSLSAFLGPSADKKPTATGQVAAKLGTSIKQAVAEAKKQLGMRVAAAEAQASPRTSADAVVRALDDFFAHHQLPTTHWIMSWDVRGNEPQADAIATCGKLQAAFSLALDQFRGPIRVDQLADGVIVHMMRKGMFGKAKPAPIDLGKHVVVSFERSGSEIVVTLKENANKASAGLRFAVHANGATWIAITTAGDAEGEPNDLDSDDVAPVRNLADRAYATLKGLLAKRRLVDLMFEGRPIADLEDPRAVPLELLAQLKPLARSLREKSRVSGELVLKRDIGDGRREELFVPRATLAQNFARLPYEYRRPFEEMGITAEETQPSIQLPMRPPAPPRASPLQTTLVELEADDAISTAVTPKK
ncbi:MAG: hypothetical protein SFX73_05570 [Kofleriaceae bacterium]|nr:hypothetical protein [Kofleriaceae bacterium]